MSKTGVFYGLVWCKDAESAAGVSERHFLLVRCFFLI